MPCRNECEKEKISRRTQPRKPHPSSWYKQGPWDEPAAEAPIISSSCTLPSPPPLTTPQIPMKSTAVEASLQRPSGFNSSWASARFSLGPGHVSQCWFPWLIYPKSALPETLAFVLAVAAVFKWGFWWEQSQRDCHYSPIIMKLMGSQSCRPKAPTRWDHNGLQNHCFPW